MNDSGFWTIARTGGLTEVETRPTASVMIALEGFVGLIATVIMAAISPLV